MGNPRRGSKSDRRGSELDLHAAARAGDLSTVESICNSNPLAVNSRDRHSRTPLHLAAWSGQTEVVNFLCQHKADVGAAAMDDTGAIHFASQKGHLEVVRVLLSSGVSVKAANRKGLTPLHYAAQGSHLELVRYLIRKGANLSAKTKGGQTPLHLAENEDVRICLKEAVESLKKSSEPNSGKKADDSALEPSEKDNATMSGDPPTNEAEEEEVGDARAKRKVEVASEDSLPESKKARVSLQHLLTENDIEDEDE
ncbi:uncharacterized protein [Typha angustifolia]|uniref:uncharacterized protein n=1 Tax=Typha angustifolia TaxID=59011 RepID=UPI003C2CC3C0